MESSNQVVPIAQSCIEAAQDIYRAVSTNPPEGGAGVNIPVERLQTLQNDGQRLSRFSKEQEGLFKKKETEQQLEFESLTREKGKHELEKNRQQKNLISLESRKDGLLQEKNYHQSSLDNARSALSSATSGLHHAEERLNKSKKDRKKKKKRGGLFGAAIGFVVGGPAGAAVGAGLGVAGSALISELEGKVDEARRNVDRCQREVSNAEANCHTANSSFQGMQPQIDSCQRSINDCEASIRRCTADSEKVHEEIGSVRQSLAFISEAIRLWNIFENLSHNATEQTRQFEEILKIVQSTQRYDFIGSSGARSTAISFLEAWNNIFAEHNVPPVISTMQASIN
uniref:Uncharacterized protein n=1 Tax=Amphimedon queenslandica TaxID=400682 RepID=A0A1X7UYG0_AMPQE